MEEIPTAHKTSVCTLHWFYTVMDPECGIPIRFYRMPHRFKSCAALCPSEDHVMH